MCVGCFLFCVFPHCKEYLSCSVFEHLIYLAFVGQQNTGPSIPAVIKSTLDLLCISLFLYSVFRSLVNVVLYAPFQLINILNLRLLSGLCLSRMVVYHLCFLLMNLLIVCLALLNATCYTGPNK